MEAVCAICNGTELRWIHCWRVGGHLDQGCGCQTRALDLAPIRGQHYFEPIPAPPQEDMNPRRAIVDGESLRLRMAEIVMLLDTVTGLTPREVRESHLEDVRRARKLAASA